MKLVWSAALAILLAAATNAFAQAKPAGEPAATAQTAAATGGPATSAAGDYDRIQVEAGLMDGSLDGRRINTLKDGAKIVLFSSTNPDSRLPISANEIKFVAPDGGGDPTSMLLTGRVVVDHPQAHVRAEKAEWDRAKNILTFTGDPIIKTPQGQEVRGQKIVVNMADSTFQVHGVVIPEWQLSGSGFGGASAAADPSLLTDQDVRDWTALLTKVRTEAAAPPSPGKQIVALLDPAAQESITTLSVETLVKSKGELLKQINKVLASPKFYNKDAWSGKEPGKPIQDLLAKKGLAGAELTRANRGLLEAAYPELIAPSKPAAQ